MAARAFRSSRWSPISASPWTRSEALVPKGSREEAAPHAVWVMLRKATATPCFPVMVRSSSPSRRSVESCAWRKRLQRRQERFCPVRFFGSRRRHSPSPRIGWPPMTSNNRGGPCSARSCMKTVSRFRLRDRRRAERRSAHSLAAFPAVPGSPAARPRCHSEWIQLHHVRHSGENGFRRPRTWPHRRFRVSIRNR